MSAMSDKKEPSTTTISTIAVQSGQTRIVIALLQVKDWIELKVLEVTPSLTLLGDNLQEAKAYRDSHHEVIQKIQSKKSPVDELLRQADEAMAKQDGCRPEVYAAMAQSLSIAWNNIHSHLEDRKTILNLNCEYHSSAEVFEDQCNAIEGICRAGLPIEIDEMKAILQRIKELHREMLIALNRALHNGNNLLQILNEIKEEGSLDSRPGQMRLQAELAKCQVERWLENLHERRDSVTTTAEAHRKQIDDCLALALITADLALLYHILSERTESLLRSTDQLGDAHASAQLFLHEHRKLLPEAKDLQEQALKIVKATEDFAAQGHFAGPEAISQAYHLLETAANYLHHIDSRESMLCRSIDFFNNAQSTMTKLDQLEIQLSTSDLGLTPGQLEQLHSNVSKSLDEVTEAAIQEGYSILQDVAGAEGVKRMVEAIENRKINLSVMCTAHREENIQANRKYTNFLEKYDQLNAWLSSMSAYMAGFQDMGNSYAMANDFLQITKSTLNDVNVKGTEINALLSTVSSVVEELDSTRSEEIRDKGESLRETWATLILVLEERIEICAPYMRAHDLAEKLNKEIDALERVMKFGEGGETEGRHAWESCKQLLAQFKNTVTNFNHLSQKVTNLDGERARLCLKSTSDQFTSRFNSLEIAWNLWLQDRETKELNNIHWERNMAASNKTVDWVSKLDAQLYPVLSEELHSARQLASHVEHKQNTVLPEIRRALQEIQLRIETAESLLSKGGITIQNEGVPIRLKELNARLQAISTDYQVLLEKFMSFFTSLSQIETRIEAVQREEQAGIVPYNVPEAEKMIRDFEATKQAVGDMFSLAINESGRITNRIKNQETSSNKDVLVVERVVESLRYDWQKTCLAREKTLERQLRRCHFDRDLQDIYKSIEQLSERLEANRGQYGDNLAAAIASSQSFNNFQEIIKVLEDRIAKFTASGEEMIRGTGGEHVERELNSLKQKWIVFKEQISQTRIIIDLIVQYFRLVEEAEEWFREGNRLLVSIARRTTHVKTVKEATELLDEIQLFLKPGEERQNQRIEEIHKIGEELQRRGCFPLVTQVRSESREMLDTFLQVRSDLHALCEKLETPVEPRTVVIVQEAPAKIEKHELTQTEFISSDVDDTTQTEDRIEVDDVTQTEIKQEVDDVTQTEAFQEEVDSVSTQTEIVTTFVESVSSHVVHEEILPMSISSEEGKSPSPPPKKVKFVDEIEDDFDDLPPPVEEPPWEAPYFTVPLQDATIEEGCKFTFECRVSGYPEPDISWEKDGISIVNNLDYQTKYDDGLCSLTIEETFVEDSARFVCQASNPAGASETSAVLSVRENTPIEEVSPPVFVTPLGSVSLKEGSKLDLRCVVAGLPLPTVQWFCGQQCVDNDPQYAITYNNGEAVLTKEAVTCEDQAAFSCVATNPYGSQTSTARLKVLRKEPSEVPRFILELGNVMARAGQKIKLECEASGSPRPELEWTLDGKPIKDNRSVKISTESGRTTLLINEAFPKDAGVYTVTAKNSAGSAETSSQVVVKGLLPSETSDSELPSDMEPVKPTIQLALKDQSVFEGKKVRLDCVIVAHPEPEVIWYHDERPVKESSDIQLIFEGDRCSLVIKEAFLEDSGHYRVVAINSAGEASSQCSLNVQAIDKSGEHATRQPVVEAMEPQVDGSPKFTKMLTDILATQGDKVVFECAVTGIPAPTVVWARNNVDVEQSDRFHMSQDAEGNCALKIIGALPEDKGVYTAKALNQHGEAKCFSQLIVKTPVTFDSKPTAPAMEENLSPPVFTEQFGDTTIAEGEPTKFECIVTGKPTPKIRWFFNDLPVAGKDFLVSTSGNRQVLTIPKSSLDLCGKISCVAENEAGKSSCSAIVSVYEPSLETSTMQQSQSSSVVEVQKSFFSSSSSSTSHVSSTSVTGSEPVVRVESHMSKSEMAAQQIGNQPVMKVETHETKDYSNISGMELKSESKVVEATGEPPKMIKPPKRSIAPRFIQPLTGCIVDLGAQVTLEAIIDGHPPPNVTWTRNGSGCPPNAETSWSLGKATLKMNNVQTPDGGRYTCTATNEAGTASATADVVVRKSSFPPVMGKRLQATTAGVGERVCLEIEVTGTPTPTVTWMKDGSIINESSGPYKITTCGNCHSVVIDKADKSLSGQYCVVASNTAGEARSLADLLVTEKMQPMSDPLFQPAIEKFQDFTLPQLPTFGSSMSQKKESVMVSESFKSEKQMSLKLEQQFSQSQNESVVGSAIPKKSSLNYFQNIIKGNEEEKKKLETKSLVSPITPTMPVDSPFGKFESVSSSIASHSVESSMVLEPGPEPEFCFVEKKAPTPKEGMVDRAKKLQESHRRLSATEIPLGGVKIFPTPAVQETVVKKQTHESFESKKQVVHEVAPQVSSVPEWKPPELPPLPPVVSQQEVKVESSKFESHQMSSFESQAQTPAPWAQSVASFDSQQEAKSWSSSQPVFRSVAPPQPAQSTTSTPAMFYTGQVSENKQESFEQPAKCPAFRSVAPPSLAVAPPGGRSPSPQPKQSWPPVFTEEFVEQKQEHFSQKVESQHTWTPAPELPAFRPVAPPELPQTSTAQRLETHQTWAPSVPDVPRAKSPFRAPAPPEPPKQSWPPVFQEEKKDVQGWAPPSQKPKSPAPSSDALAMEKLWSHKLGDIKPSWPPAKEEKLEKTLIQKSSHSESMQSFTQSSVQSSVETQHAVLEPFQMKPPPDPNAGKIIYVAEAKASHVANIFNRQEVQSQVTKKSSMREESSYEKIERSTPKIKQSWPPVFAPEPGPPPELGFATPPPKERRQSYVEMIEEDLKKDLIKEPTRVPVGGVQTIPPNPKKEELIFRRSSSLTEEMKQERVQMPTKFDTIPRPSKFVKKPFGSDYESDVDSFRIKAMWSPWESDSEMKTFRHVQPPEPQEQSQYFAAQSSSQESYYKSQLESLSAKSISQSQSHTQTHLASLRPEPDSGYMADTDEPHFIRQSRLAMEEQSRKSWSCEKKEPVKLPGMEPFPFKPEPARPTVKVPPPPSPSKFIKGDFKESDYDSDRDIKIKPVWRPPSTEPIDPTFRPVKPVLAPVLQPTLPEFDHGQAKPKFQPIEMPQTPVKLTDIIVKPLPMTNFPKAPVPVPPKEFFNLKPGSPPEMKFAPTPPGYGKAVETSNVLNFSESTEKSQRVVSMHQTTRVINFEQSRQEQQFVSPKFIPKGEAKWASDSESELSKLSELEFKAEERRLKRVEEMRRRFGERTAQSAIDLKPGDAPKFDYAPPRIPPAAATIASQQMSDMNTNFKTRAQQFVSDVIQDVKQNGRDKRPDEPQVYREETRNSEKGSNVPSSPYPDLPHVVNAGSYIEVPKKAPFFITPLRNIAVVAGQTARFECIVQAEPAPAVAWSKDSLQIQPSYERVIEYRNGVCRLTLPQAFLHDAGIFCCSATNEMGSQETHATLQVTGEGRTYLSN